MNRVVALLLSVLSPAAFASAQVPPSHQKPSGGTTASVTVSLDGKGSIGLLATVDRIEVEKYEKDLKVAGLAIEEVSILVADDIQIRIAAGKTGTVAPGAPPAPPTQGPGMGPYVRALVQQGVRGRDLAAAIHAEKARRRDAAGHGKGPGKEHAKEAEGGGGEAPGRGAGKAPEPSGKTPDANPDRRGPPKGDKTDAGRPTPPPSDESDKRPQGQPGKQKAGQGHGGGKPGKQGGKPKGQPKDDGDDG